MFRIGLEVFLQQDVPTRFGDRIGFLSNQACTNRYFRYGKDLLQEKLAKRLTCLFSPQHGFYAEKQDNMIESAHHLDLTTGLPIYSLYGEHRKPTEEMFDQLDTLLIDLPDIGTRVYTFMYTMAYCLQAAAQYGKKIVILDRPNPLGGEQIEGNLLRDDCRSFVGMYALPMRHGLTLGELALFFNKEYAIGADLEVVAVQGWRRDMYFSDCPHPWLAPSPNMPTLEAAINYPGQVIWEGTHVSEGRGTTLPFSVFGTPYWQHDEVLAFLQRYPLAGCVLRPLLFEPTSGKWAGNTCTGFQLHIQSRKDFNSYRVGMILLQAAMLVYRQQFEYKKPPYEYEYEKLPMDLILGDRALREALEAGESVVTLEQGWQAELLDYDRRRRCYFLYQ
ncbi:exo-beta-N-acetylmuramidase NamZ family protein [Desulfotalea psychrophila]|uniref:DUF1343 domain-containing protein n=1 Tax=Desulfotalea psychrophila (strain LSv54 / DSM 12343) TaxID=177439 RepID=Q6AJ05_DESPS|nr:DUF1343 domain-containing protein [Desulfotalea psychrophila]CAG37675.1 conserved hypothetical protein [Desulfotalea psychrophila LSv54]